LELNYLSDETNYITNYLALYCSLYITVAYEGEPKLSPNHIKKIREYIFKHAVDDENLKENSNMDFTDYCEQAMDESINLHAMLLDAGGDKAIIENYSFLLGSLGSYNGPGRNEILNEIYGQLSEVAKAEGKSNITPSQKLLLEKTAQAWEL